MRTKSNVDQFETDKTAAPLPITTYDKLPLQNTNSNARTIHTRRCLTLLACGLRTSEAIYFVKQELAFSERMICHEPF